RSSVGAATAGEVARLYRLGPTMAEIAGSYRVPAWTVTSRLDQAGIPRRRASRAQATLPIERAARRDRRQPHRLTELAAELGISAQFIVDWSLRTRSRERGQPRNRVDVRTGEVAGLYRAGWTITRIAARYQVATSTVLRRLDEAGWRGGPKAFGFRFRWR